MFKKKYKIRYFIIIIFCLTLAFLLTIISAPGFFNSDAYARSGMVQHILNFDMMSLDVLETRLSILPVLLMALSQKMVNSYSLYTFVCAFLYFLGSALILEKIGSSNRYLKYIMFLINPVLICVSVWSVPGVLCSAMVLFLIMILFKEFKKYDYFLLFICSTLIIGYRENALIILPVIFFYIIYKKNITKLQKVFCCISILSSIVFLSLLTNFYNIKKITVCKAGFAWEILNVIDRLPEEKRCSYANGSISCLDIKNAINLMKIDNTNINGFYWNPTTSFFIYNYKDIDIIPIFIKVIKDNPKIYAYVKLNFIMNNLGITKPLSIMEVEYNRDNLMGRFNFNDSTERKILFSLLYNSIKRSLIQYPYILFLLSIWLVSLAKIRNSKNYELYLLMFLCSIFYYFAFLIVTVSFEIRYFFPSYYLMCIMNIGIITEIISKKEEPKSVLLNVNE